MIRFPKTRCPSTRSRHSACLPYALVVAVALLVVQPVTAEPFAYITNFFDGTVSIVDLAPSPAAVVATVTVGANPYGVAVDSDQQIVYVANSDDNTVSVIDVSTIPAQVIHTVAVGSEPNGLAVTPDGSLVLVANYAGNSVSVIDASLAIPAVIDTVTVGEGPEYLVINADGTRAYVGNTEDNTGTSTVTAMGIASTSVTVLDTFDVGPEAHGVALAPDGDLWVVTTDDGKLSSFETAGDTHNNLKSVTTGARLYGLTLSPAGDRAFVSNPEQTTILVVDITTQTPTVVDTIPVGEAVFGMDTSADGSLLYALSIGDQLLRTYDVSQVPAVLMPTTQVGQGPLALGDFVSQRAATIFTDGFESGDLTAWSP